MLTYMQEDMKEIGKQGLGGFGCGEVGEEGVELPEWQVLLGEGTADVCSRMLTYAGEC